ncbi:hypothetical protein [Hymenobacter jeollabukensis]|uniref:Glycosyltransferase RgtA/B/C/D-like domain-containing protein n=1 Tax=Hymenobacter jeollabukensis TaxID=2025313 RepID=A0A5R8WXL9_9BACT|nr:hypothetical protein [Hymenobacter jeollabukensis]TLM96803.1 hypothetical protein FDY95_02080 [Hymenobacter jeollabukensis]
MKESASKRPLLENSLLWFFIVFLVFSTHLLTSKYNTLYYDSHDYWKYAKTFVVDDKFSLLNFTDRLRGYVYPLLNYPLIFFFSEGDPEPSSKEMVAIKLLGALYASTIFAVVAPSLWMAVTRTNRLGWFRRLAFAAAGFFMWRDYFNFTLSDFPGLLAVMAAILAAYKLRNIPGAFLVGVLTAAAIYIRPVYVLSAPFLLLLVVQQQAVLRQKYLHARNYLALAAFAGGLVLVGLPQYLINKTNLGSNSVLVLADNEYYLVAGKPNLYLWQLNSGLKVQRYETNIGGDYPNAQVFFNDLAGQTMLNNEGVAELTSYADYFLFMLKRPVDAIALYGRHLFNGLDILYTTPYLAHVHAKALWLSFLNYTYFFSALLVLIFAKKNLRIDHWLILAALLLPCAACVPMVVECRFFLPLHLLLYAVACFGWPSHWQGQFKQLTRLQLTRLATSYAFFLLICFMLSSSTQATLQMATKIIQP